MKLQQTNSRICLLLANSTQRTLAMQNAMHLDKAARVKRFYIPITVSIIQKLHVLARTIASNYARTLRVAY